MNYIELDYYNSTDRAWFDEIHELGEWGVIIDHERTGSNEYTVKIDDSDTDKRIKEIAKNQPNFKEGGADTKAKEGDLVSFDYTATVDEKSFKGGDGKNTQLTLGKDLFLKGFDKQLIGVKKDDQKIVEATLPENFPEKDLVNNIKTIPLLYNEINSFLKFIEPSFILSLIDFLT